MPKSKLTLIIDGNWLFMSRLSVLAGKYYDDYELTQNLNLLLLRSIKIALRQFPDIDNIMLCVDGGSWRTKVEQPVPITDENGNPIEYKGNREKSDDINWDVIFEGYNKLCEMLKRYGINVYREQDIEGDDWIWYWTNKLNSESVNCIIWTKDNDLKQLIKINKDKCFTIWWNKDNGIFCPEYSEDNFDFLFNSDYNTNSEIFSNVIRNKQITVINPNNIVIDKIIRGDVSDNIAPIIIKKPSSATSNRKYKISPKDIDYNLNYTDNKAVRDYIHNIFFNKKYYGKIYENSENNIFLHFTYNRQLIYLDKSSYPKEILEVFDKYTNYNVSKDISGCEAELLAETNQLNGILNII